MLFLFLVGEGKKVMLKKVRLVVGCLLGSILMAGVLCYACIGIHSTPLLASEESQDTSSCKLYVGRLPVYAGDVCKKCSDSCCTSEKSAGCDFTEGLKLTPEQQAQIEKLKTELEKKGEKCITAESIQKVKDVLTKEEGEELDAIVAKMKNRCSTRACK